MKFFLHWNRRSFFNTVQMHSDWYGDFCSTAERKSCLEQQEGENDEFSFLVTFSLLALAI